MILKRIEKTTLYKGIELGDRFRPGWKKKIELRGQNIINNVSSGSPSILGQERRKITTTLYVPASEESILLEEMIKTKEVIGGDMDWGIKIMEKCRSPLHSIFMKKFAI